ncbi:MAG: NUDIX domain-containing protein [Flavobacteriales bacterium]
MKRFNIRVYGLLVDNGRVLVSDEIIRGQRITKFPGGGLELGEGTKDCLMRELREEMGIEANDLRHFHTTDHFQQSAYNESDQLISIYYRYSVPNVEALPYGTSSFGDPASGAEWFRWLDLGMANVDTMSLPVDRVVLALLMSFS